MHGAVAVWAPLVLSAHPCGHMLLIARRSLFRAPRCCVETVGTRNACRLCRPVWSSRGGRARWSAAYSGSALRVTQQPPFGTPTASHLPGPHGAQSGSQSRPGQPSSVCRAKLGVCPPLSPGAGWAPWHRELYVSRMAGLALGEHVDEPGRKGAVRSAAGEAGNQPSPWKRDRCARPTCGSGICRAFPSGVGAVEAEALGSREVLSSALAAVSRSPPLPLGGGPWTAARAGAASGAGPGLAGPVGVGDPCGSGAVWAAAPGVAAWLRWVLLAPPYLLPPASWRYNCVAQTIKKIVLPS